jgi:predicted RNase H-like nuclease (RuvC/YqgF family)
MDRVLLQESTVEGDDLVDMKSERKHVERGKWLKLEVKQLKSKVKQLKLKVKRLKSELKHVKRSTRLKSEPEQKQTGDRCPSVCKLKNYLKFISISN